MGQWVLVSHSFNSMNIESKFHFEREHLGYEYNPGSLRRGTRCCTLPAHLLQTKKVDDVHHSHLFILMGAPCVVWLPSGKDLLVCVYTRIRHRSRWWHPHSVNSMKQCLAPLLGEPGNICNLEILLTNQIKETTSHFVYYSIAQYTFNDPTSFIKPSKCDLQVKKFAVVFN